MNSIPETESSKPKIVVIVGPTASGKSKVALELAERFHGEIISADSMQVYRYMDIGTAKPSMDERQRVCHHLIDIRNPDEGFDAAMFRDGAAKSIMEISDRGNLPFVTGGTGLYIKALTEGIFEAPGVDKDLRERLINEAANFGLTNLYNKLRDIDPEAAGKIGPTNTHRIIRALEIFYMTGSPISQHHREHAFPEKPYHVLKIGLHSERETLYKNIDDRVDSMLRAGLADEVKRILEMGYSPYLKGMQGIGYSHICKYIKGEYSLKDAITLIKRDTRHYAKRQMTWFRRDNEIIWFDAGREGFIGDIFSEVGRFAVQK